MRRALAFARLACCRRYRRPWPAWPARASRSRATWCPCASSRCSPARSPSGSRSCAGEGAQVRALAAALVCPSSLPRVRSLRAADPSTSALLACTTQTALRLLLARSAHAQTHRPASRTPRACRLCARLSSGSLRPSWTTTAKRARSSSTRRAATSRRSRRRRWARLWAARMRALSLAARSRARRVCSSGRSRRTRGERRAPSGRRTCGAVARSPLGTATARLPLQSRAGRWRCRR